MHKRLPPAAPSASPAVLSNLPTHLHLLDVLRGLASLAVVLWHYQQFYFVAPGRLAPGFARSNLPFYELLWPFYQYGAYAVQMFFVLSGFVFYFIYSDSINKKEIIPLMTVFQRG